MEIIRNDNILYYRIKNIKDRHIYIMYCKFL